MYYKFDFINKIIAHLVRLIYQSSCGNRELSLIRVHRAIFKWGWMTFPGTRVVMLSIHDSAMPIIYPVVVYIMNGSRREIGTIPVATSNKSHRANLSQKWMRFCSLHARIHGLSYFRICLYGSPDGSHNLMHEDRVKLSVDKMPGRDIPVFPVSLNIWTVNIRFMPKIQKKICVNNIKFLIS